MIKALKLWLLGDSSPAQKDTFYTYRTAGIDYLPPTFVSNPACYGTVTTVEPVVSRDSILILTSNLADHQNVIDFYESNKWDVFMEIFVNDEFKEPVLRFQTYTLSNCFQTNPKTMKQDSEPTFEFFDVKLNDRIVMGNKPLVDWDAAMIAHGYKLYEGKATKTPVEEAIV